MIGYSCDPGGLVNWYIRLSCEELEFLLIPCVDIQGNIRLDRIIEISYIIVDECLIGSGVSCTDMVEELGDGDAIQSIIGVAK